jgi:cytosine permease
VQSKAAEAIEDHALEAVPLDQRHSWVPMAWNSTGAVTTLVQLFVGAITCFVAGIQLALTAGLVATLIGTAIGWACGHIAYKTGLSSTVMSRQYGFGRPGSAIFSAIFAFVIIGFLALENALLFKGVLFFAQVPETWPVRIGVYGIMTIAWIVLTAFGFKLVSRASSVIMTLFLLILAWMLWKVAGMSSGSQSDLLTFPTQFPSDFLARLGATTTASKFFFCINTVMGGAGALALFSADQSRYARSSRDSAIASLMGSIALCVVIVAVGGLIMHAGMPALVKYYATTGGLSETAANETALQSPDSIAAAFVIIGGGLGTILMVLANSKVQVVNTYVASLSLANLFDVVKLRISRLACVVIANVLGLIMLSGDILKRVAGLLNIFGVATTALAAVMIADYYFVRRFLPRDGRPDRMNWAGVISATIAVSLAHWSLAKLFPLEFATTFVITTILYPILRFWAFRPAAGCREVSVWGS